MEEMMTDIMRTRISQLEEENRALHQELADRSAKLHDAQAAMDVLRDDAHQVIGQWAEDAKKARAQCEELGREKSELIQTIASLEARSQEVMSINISFASKLQRLENDLEEATRSKSELTQRLTEASRAQVVEQQCLERDIETLRQELKNTEEMRTLAVSEAQRWESDCIEALALVHSLRQERQANANREADLGNLLCTAEGKIAALTEEVLLLQSSLKAAREIESQAERLSKSLEEHVILLAEAAEARSGLQSEVQRLKGDMAIAAACISKLQDDSQAHDVAAETLLQENTKIKAQLLEMGQEKSMLERECSSLRGSVQDLSLQVTESKTAHSKANSRADDLESDIAEHLDTIESMKKVIQSLEEQVAWQTSQCASFKSSAEKLATEIDAVRSEFNRSHTENLSLKSKLTASSALESELRAVTESVRLELEDKLKAAESGLCAAETRHADILREQHKNLVRLQEKEKECTDLQTALEEARSNLVCTQNAAGEAARASALELSTLRATEAFASAEAARWREKLSVAEGELEKCRNDLQRKSREANDAREQQKMAEHMLSQTVLEQQEEHDRAASAAETLELELRAAKRAAESAKERYDAAENECNELRGEIHRLRFAVVTKSEELLFSEKERESLIERNKNFELLLSQHGAAIGALEAKAQASDALRSEKRALQQELVVMQNRLASAHDEHERMLQAKEMAGTKADAELKLLREQHTKLKAAFEEAKSRCAAAEDAMIKSTDELNAVIRNRDEIITKFNTLHDRHTQFKKQVQDGQIPSTKASDGAQRIAALESSLARVSKVCRDQEAQLESLRSDHATLQRAMNMTRTTTATLEEFHKSSGLSVQNLNTVEGPRRHPRKRSLSQHSETTQRSRVESQSRSCGTQLN